MAEHPAEVVADFQRYYGLDATDIASIGCRRAACLCSCLPSESALKRAYGDGWSEAERLLAMIGRGIDTVWWQRTKDGQRQGAEPPDRYTSPRERRRRYEESVKYDKAYRDEVAEALGIPIDRR